MIYVKPEIAVLGNACQVILGLRFAFSEPFPNTWLPRILWGCELDA